MTKRQKEKRVLKEYDRTRARLLRVEETVLRNPNPPKRLQRKLSEIERYLQRFIERHTIKRLREFYYKY